MSMTGIVAVAMLCLFTNAEAAGLKGKAASSSSSLQAAVEQDVKFFGTKLRGNILSNWANDAQELRNEDDDDEDDEDEAEDAVDAQEAAEFATRLAHSGFGTKYEAEKTKEEGAKPVALHMAEPKSEPKAVPEAAPVKLANKSDAKAPAGLKAPPKATAEEDEEDEKDETPEEKAEDKAEDEQEDKEEETKGALEAAHDKVKAAQGKVDAFSDDKAFDAKIAHDVKLITNETQSPALSNFMGELRLEMRSYAKPAYPAYLEARADKAEKRVKELEGELDKEKKAAPAKAAEVGEDKKKESAKLEKEGGSLSAKEVAQKAGETWALGFFANIVLIAVVFAMASGTKNMLVKNYTWFVIDQVIAIFLAVMYFQAFDSLLDFHEMGVGNEIVCSLLHAFAMLAMVLWLATLLRKNDLAMAVLCGCGAHVVSFSSIHAGAGLQNYWMGMSYFWTTCILGMIVLGSGLAVIGYLIYTAKKKARLFDQEGFMDKTDDLENDFGAMAFSVVFTMFVRFLLTGHHPVDDETEFDHSAADRLHMFLYGCVCLIVAGTTVKFTAKKAADTDSYAVKRVMNFFSTVACMNVAWAFLYWGEWQFFGYLYPEEAIKGRVMFAIVATIVCGLGLLGLTQLPSPTTNSALNKSKLVALTALSLVCGWSWELCFDAAVEEMTEGVAHPVVFKVVSAVTLFAVVVPVYALCVKPISGPAAEAIGA